MKSLPCLFLLAIVGCASNPLMTGKPQHWVGHTAEELSVTLGEPTRRIKQSDGEIWEYVQKGNYNAPAEDNTSFKMGGLMGSSGGFGAGGGIKTTKRAGGATDYENLWRFMLKKGKVSKWYAQRMEGGRIVWSDH